LALVLPPGVLLPCLIMAVWAIRRSQVRLALIALMAPACATLALSLPLCARMLAAPLERAARDAARVVTPPRAARTAVVLGGGMRATTVTDASPIGAYNLMGAADRVVAAVRLWRRHEVDQVVFTGSGRGVSDAELMARFAEDLGLPRRAMLLEGDARNTRENAQFTARLLQQHALSNSVRLVTSGIHMPRAVRELRCAGLVPFPVLAEYDALGDVGETAADWMPSADALDLSRRALKEWIASWMGQC